MDNSENLYSTLKSFSQSDLLPMHMPGHKRNTAMLGSDFPYSIDFTEIYGLDNLHNPKGIIAGVQEKAAFLYGGSSAFLLVNGSTCGILAAVHSTVSHGGDIIMARNCHKSVYNAAALCHANTYCIYPPTDAATGVCASVTPESVERAFVQCPHAQAVIVTSPTYEGVMSDIPAIADIAHSHGVPLIVDGAHGAHLRFMYGKDCYSGADIVIMSLHKTLPALTQTAVAVLNGSLVNPKDFAASLGIFETSSPSYILMASAERCFDFLIKDGERYFCEYKCRLNSFSQSMRGLKHLSVLCVGEDSLQDHEFFLYDFSKITVCTRATHLSGVRLMDILRSEYRIELEMAYPHYAVAMTSVCDTAESFDRLTLALLDIDKTLRGVPEKAVPAALPKLDKAPPEQEIQHIAGDDERGLTVGKAVGCYIYAYPPGVPLAVPNETVSEELVRCIDTLRESGVDVIFI